MNSVALLETLEQALGSVEDILTLISTSILVLAIAIILFVLYFIVGAVITRRRYLVIQKAMGYTNFELMRQVSISFLLPLVAGIAFGATLSILTFNNVASLIMSPLGIRQANFDVPYLWIALTSIALVVISYATILLITGRIRKISAYDLKPVFNNA